MQVNKLNPLDIPIIIDKICSFLSIDNLMTLRLLNRCWNQLIKKTLKGRKNGPIVKLTNRNKLVAHIRFLDDREYKFIDWFREYEFNIDMDGSESNVSDFMVDGVKLIEVYRQHVVSMKLKYINFSGTLVNLSIGDPRFQTLISELKEIRFDIENIHRNNAEDPQKLVDMLNTMPNLMSLYLCYKAVYSTYTPDDYKNTYSFALSRINRLSKLEKLITNLSFHIIITHVMPSLKFLKIFVGVTFSDELLQGLFKLLRDKCPSLKELYLVRGAYSGCVFELGLNEGEWFRNTRKLETEFPNVNVVVDKKSLFEDM